jgi:hypothetical protein
MEAFFVGPDRLTLLAGSGEGGFFSGPTDRPDAAVLCDLKFGAVLDSLDLYAGAGLGDLGPSGVPHEVWLEDLERQRRGAGDGAGGVGVTSDVPECTLPESLLDLYHGGGDMLVVAHRMKDPFKLNPHGWVRDPAGGDGWVGDEPEMGLSSSVDEGGIFNQQFLSLHFHPLHSNNTTLAAMCAVAARVLTRPPPIGPSPDASTPGSALADACAAVCKDMRKQRRDGYTPPPRPKTACCDPSVLTPSQVLAFHMVRLGECRGEAVFAEASGLAGQELEAFVTGTRGLGLIQPLVLTGAAGAGKSFVIDTIDAYVTARGRGVVHRTAGTLSATHNLGGKFSTVYFAGLNCHTLGAQVQRLNLMLPHDESDVPRVFCLVADEMTVNAGTAMARLYDGAYELLMARFAAHGRAGLFVLIILFVGDPWQLGGVKVVNWPESSLVEPEPYLSHAERVRAGLTLGPRIDVSGGSEGVLDEEADGGVSTVEPDDPGDKGRRPARYASIPRLMWLLQHCMLSLRLVEQKRTASSDRRGWHERLHWYFTMAQRELRGSAHCSLLGQEVMLRCCAEESYLQRQRAVYARVHCVEESSDAAQSYARDRLLLLRIDVGYGLSPIAVAQTNRACTDFHGTYLQSVQHPAYIGAIGGAGPIPGVGADELPGSAPPSTSMPSPGSRSSQSPFSMDCASESPLPRSRTTPAAPLATPSSGTGSDAMGLTPSPPLSGPAMGLTPSPPLSGPATEGDGSPGPGSVVEVADSPPATGTSSPSERCTTPGGTALAAVVDPVEELAFARMCVGGLRKAACAHAGSGQRLSKRRPRQRRKKKKKKKGAERTPDPQRSVHRAPKVYRRGELRGQPVSPDGSAVSRGDTAEPTPIARSWAKYERLLSKCRKGVVTEPVRDALRAYNALLSEAAPFPYSRCKGDGALHITLGLLHRMRADDWPTAGWFNGCTVVPFWVVYDAGKTPPSPPDWTLVYMPSWSGPALLSTAPGQALLSLLRGSPCDLYRRALPSGVEPHTASERRFLRKVVVVRTRVGGHRLHSGRQVPFELKLMSTAHGLVGWTVDSLLVYLGKKEPFSGFSSVVLTRVKDFLTMVVPDLLPGTDRLLASVMLRDELDKVARARSVFDTMLGAAEARLLAILVPWAEALGPSGVAGPPFLYAECGSECFGDLLRAVREREESLAAEEREWVEWQALVGQYAEFRRRLLLGLATPQEDPFAKDLAAARDRGGVCGCAHCVCRCGASGCGGGDARVAGILAAARTFEASSGPPPATGQGAPRLAFPRGPPGLCGGASVPWLGPVVRFLHGLVRCVLPPVAGPVATESDCERKSVAAASPSPPHPLPVADDARSELRAVLDRLSSAPSRVPVARCDDEVDLTRLAACLPALWSPVPGSHGVARHVPDAATGLDALLSLLLPDPVPVDAASSLSGHRDLEGLMRALASAPGPVLPAAVGAISEPSGATTVRLCFCRECGVVHNVRYEQVRVLRVPVPVVGLDPFRSPVDAGGGRPIACDLLDYMLLAAVCYPAADSGSALGLCTSCAAAAPGHAGGAPAGPPDDECKVHTAAIAQLRSLLSQPQTSLDYAVLLRRELANEVEALAALESARANRSVRRSPIPLPPAIRALLSTSVEQQAGDVVVKPPSLRGLLAACWGAVPPVLGASFSIRPRSFLPIFLERVESGVPSEVHGGSFDRRSPVAISVPLNLSPSAPLGNECEYALRVVVLHATQSPGVMSGSYSCMFSVPVAGCQPAWFSDGGQGVAPVDINDPERRAMINEHAVLLLYEALPFHDDAGAPPAAGPP